MRHSIMRYLLSRTFWILALALALSLVPSACFGAEPYDCAANWTERVKIAGRLASLRQRAEQLCPRGPNMKHCDGLQAQASALLDRQLVLEVLADTYGCPAHPEME